MEYQHKLLLLAALLVVVALYVVATMAPQQPEQADTSKEQALLLKSAGFGKGLGDYTYSYSETTNGYKTTYSLVNAGDSGIVEIGNPLSTKRIYLLPNDTILCIKYPIEESCSSIQQNTEMQNYISFARSKLFNDTNIAKAETDMQILLNRGYLHLDGGMEDVVVGTTTCRQVTYTIDYSNATVDDAARYGIGAASPKVYRITRCIEPESGLAYQTTMTYNDKINNTRTTRVVSFKESAASITPPANLSGDAVEVFRKERADWLELALCYTDIQGDDRDKCLSGIALNLHRKDLCELAGGRNDMCLLSIVPYTKDETICLAISDSAYKDNCYGVLADVYKDSSYCANIQDSAKKEMCMEVAAPHGPAQDGNQTSSGNETGATDGAGQTNASGDGGNQSEVDINKLLDYIDKNTSTKGNSTDTNGSNESG
ncbi:hypothetical protein H0O00_02910 [Candidatus Micrarchaeota archaeon]|nr:hypothetical protein [Candidatus Micrarchaeota archaeon]